jgi:hypothetical protein
LERTEGESSVTLRLAVLCLLVAVFGSACSSDGTVDGPVLTRAASLIDPGGDDAQVLGTVVVDVNAGCVQLELEGTPYPVVWPAGAKWNATVPGIEIGGDIITHGAEVVGSGGWYAYDRVEDLVGSAVADAAQRCIGPTNETAMFNTKSKVSIGD